MLHRCGMGFGLVGLTGLLADDGVLGDENAAATNPLAVKQPHFPARAKHVVHLFMNGGASVAMPPRQIAGATSGSLLSTATSRQFQRGLQAVV